MDTNEMRRLENEFSELLIHAGMPSWRMRWTNSVSIAGMCIHRKRTINLSRPIALLNPLDQFKLVPLHEIAHALTPGHNHDKVWRAKCLEIGGDGERCHTLKTPPKQWEWQCMAGGCWGTSHRRARHERVCVKHDAALTWRKRSLTELGYV